MAQPFVIMLVDDSDDRLFTQSVMSEAGIDIHIEFIENSNNFFEKLQEGPLPALILIDYNTHPDQGPDVVRKLKSDARLKEIPAVILSDSDLDRYRSASYQAGANSYVIKPRAMDQSTFKIKTFFDYWFGVADVSHR